MVDDRHNRIKFIRRVVVDKLDRRKLLTAFSRYKECTKLHRQYTNEVEKGNEYAEILRFRSLRRMFRAYKNYWYAFHIARINLRKKLLDADRRSKKSFFELWLKETKHEVKEMRREQ